MVQSPPQPEALDYKPNASNASSPCLGYSFGQAALQSSSPCITEISSSIQSLDITDENTPPPARHPDDAKTIHSSTGQTSEQTELALVKAELESTLRKLAEFEGQKARDSHIKPQLVKYNPTSRNLFAAKPSSALHPRATLCFPDPSFAQVPAPPHPLPVKAASAELSPLQLPSSVGGVFPARDSFSSVSLPPQETIRSISSSLPPIGDHLRPGPIQRSFSLDAKNPSAQMIWNADSEWSPPWTSSTRTRTGQQAVLGPGLLEPWHDPILYPGPASPRHPIPEQPDWHRTFDRPTTCDWDVPFILAGQRLIKQSVIKKIICQNDQHASLFIQQKLKLGTSAQKHQIVDTIVCQSHPLMVNRFGNFLVQRCFEYGTKDQIDGVIKAILGNVVTLSKDMFGCHVIQKAFDCVDEEIKVAMVEELIVRIPETISHRFACHVWQKILEIRWRGCAPVIMKYVNDALRGLWTEIALGETGSLVVQNVFENCLDEDKRPCIEEILENIDTIARGQWGNWVVQHIVEHGHPEDRLRALEIILKNAAAYSTDQFASKIIEKALKSCGHEFFHSYIGKVTEKEPGRPRVALVDICSDVHGNYLIQHLLQNGPPAVRDQITFHVRKHMVSLRGNRYGQRIAYHVERLKVMSQKSATITTNWHGRWD